jgi:hypothetical protein
VLGHPFDAGYDLSARPSWVMVDDHASKPIKARTAFREVLILPARPTWIEPVCFGNEWR